MILGMTTSTFTLVHVLISLVGIGSGFVVMYGLLAEKRLDGWTAIFLATTVLTSARVPLSSRAHFAVSHRWRHIAGSVSRCAGGPLRSAHGAFVALDLRDLRCPCSLSECIRRGSPVVPEDTGAARLGTDAEGAAVSGRATSRHGNFSGDWHSGGEEIPRRTDRNRGGLKNRSLQRMGTTHARALSIIAFQMPLDLRTSSTASRTAPRPATAFVV
jgi:hypothetical protein